MGVNSANKGYIGRNIDVTYGSYSGIESTRKEFNDLPPVEVTPYVRPSEWVTIPGITQGEQKFVGTFAVYNHDSNFVAFTIAGNYNVDWGDGTTGAFSSGVQANKRYDTTTYSGLTSAVFRGYKTLNITITPQSGANITSINLANKHNQSTLSNYTNQWLDIKFSAPNLSNSTSSFFMYSESIPMGMLEQFEWVNLVNNYNNVTYNSMFRNCYSLRNIISIPNTKAFSTSTMFTNCSALETVPFFDTSLCTATNGMFQNCPNLKIIPQFDTSNSTDANLMFQTCRSLLTIPPLNFSKVTNFNATFAGCKNLIKIPFINTESGTNFAAMFSDCPALETIPPLNTSKGTNFLQMVRWCRSLKEFPLIDTSSATNMYGMFEGCWALKTVPKLNTSNVTNFGQMFYDCWSIQNIPFIDTSKGTDFTEMFMFGYNIDTVPAFNLSSGTIFASMFRLCYTLKYLPDFNVSKGVNFNLMMGQCQNFLRAPNLILGTAGITFTTNAFENMFLNNIAMAEVPAYDLSGVCFGTSYANVYNAMLSGCVSLSKVGITGFNHNINISGCKLSGTALNELYSSLAVVGASGSGTKTITVSSNWGAATDNPSIAIAKGWTVTG